MALRTNRFVGELRRRAKIALDTPLLIYHLEDVGPYADLTEVLFDAIAGGSPAAVLSTISVTELLVKPFAEGWNDRVAAFERFLRGLPHATLVPPTYEIAKEAARLRGRHGLRTPDALLIATALSERAGAFVTNDRGLRTLGAEGMPVLVLDDYV